MHGDVLRPSGRLIRHGGLAYLFAGKAPRVFVFSMVSILAPVYLTALGYSAFYVGIALAAMVAGNIFSNIMLTWYGGHLGRKRFLLTFSLLMLVSGAMLSATTYFPLMLLAFFIGNISTTATEAGPFQSIETGILPRLVPVGLRNRAFGVYNLIGYSAASVGALSASIPSYFQGSLAAFRILYLAYGLVGLLLVMLYLRLKDIEPPQSGRRRGGLGDVPPAARRDIVRLSALFSIDAFGGGFVSQSLLSYWFFFVYRVPLGNLGIIFFVVNTITALSTLGASILADRFGNLRTMVYTHIVSNFFLIFIPLAGSLQGALLFLFLRQSMSQMDVPTRQAFMAEIFDDRERVTANSVTNTSRTVSGVFGAPVSGALLTVGLISVPLLASGFSKILYDLLILWSYREKKG